MFIKDKLYDLSVAVHQKMHRNTNPKKPMRLNRRKVGERVFLCVMLAYPVLQFLIFYVTVNINSVLLAFKTFSGETGGYYFNGLINFKNVIYTLSHDTAIASSFGRGMIMYACGVIIGIPLHFSVAYLLYKKIPLAGFFRVVLFIPSLVPGIAIAIMFKYFVEYGVSEIYKIFGAETIPNFFMDPDVAFPLVIFYGIWVGVASGMVIYMSAMSRIPQSIIEYGQLEGITLFRELRSVILPMIYPTLCVFLVTSLAGLFTSSGALYTFYKDSAQEEMQTFGYYMFTRVIGENASYEQYPYAAAAGLLLTLVTAPIVLLARWALDKFGPTVEY